MKDVLRGVLSQELEIVACEACGGAGCEACEGSGVRGDGCGLSSCRVLYRVQDELQLHVSNYLIICLRESEDERNYQDWIANKSLCALLHLVC